MSVGSLPVLVDTDVMSSVVLPRTASGHSPANAEWQSLLFGRRVVIAVQTRVELLTWPLVSRWGDRRAQQLRAAVDAVPTIQISEEVQNAFVELTASAKNSGHAIHAKVHTGDRWIAATALAAGLPLASGDSVFAGVPGLDLLIAV